MNTEQDFTGGDCGVAVRSLEILPVKNLPGVVEHIDTVIRHDSRHAAGQAQIKVTK